jgi:Glycosyltransferase family 87
MAAFTLVIFTAVAAQKYALGHFNNYLMFAKPFHNLLINKTIYGLHPDLFEDNYKYSPTFAWLMGPFYYMPNWLGVLLWNLLNATMLVAGIWHYLSAYVDANRKRVIVLLIVFVEGLTTAQNMQSNNFIAGALLLGIYFLRNQHVWLAAFLFTLCLYIKFYGVGAAIFFIFYPKKGEFLLAMVVWTILLGLAPWTMLPWPSVVSEYTEWGRVVVDSKLGVLTSIPGILVAWFGMAKTDGNLRILELIGSILFLAPFARFSLWKDRTYQCRMLAYFLLFVIIFNKMAESPTYVLAVLGVALWWVTLSPPVSTTDKILLALVIVFTSLSPTDLFPKVWQNSFFVPYSIKAVPCVLIWIRLQYQLWTQIKTTSEITSEPTSLLTS